MTEHIRDIAKVDAIHIYPKGEQHDASMDCFCELISWVSIEHPRRDGRPLHLIVHGSAIAISTSMGPGDGDEDDDDEEDARR